MKVLLLGANGQLGHDIRSAHKAAASEAAESFDLVALTRKELDVTVPGAVERILGEIEFDALVNCISYHKTDEVEDNATLAFTVNAHSVQAMSEACTLKGARFMHVSTDYVFGADTERRTPLTEDDATAPVNVYGASKAMGENLARVACDDVVILRVASLFGVAGASGKGGNFVETMIRVGRERGELQVVADQVMSPTATADIAQVVLRLLARGCEPGTYHVVNDGPASWFEFARAIIDQAGIKANVSPCTTEEYPTRAMRPAYSVLDHAKVSNIVGKMPPWEDALDRYLRAKGYRKS